MPKMLMLSFWFWLRVILHMELKRDAFGTNRSLMLPLFACQVFIVIHMCRMARNLDAQYASTRVGVLACVQILMHI